jgi:hypothetical protein
MLMATRTDSTVVNAAGLVQGIALVTFPAASTIFTSRSYYGLSSTQYGDMFLPQVAMGIAASLLAARLARLSGAGFGLTVPVPEHLYLGLSPRSG